MTAKQKLFLFSIVILAIFFRFYLLSSMPGGLFPDEAANGLDINLMQQGQLQPFYERGNGREALFFYMLWGNVELFGKGPWQHHAVSALVGVLSVLVCFGVTRRLFSSQNGDYLQAQKATNIALLASFLMAVSSWHTVLSRTAFRANLIPLFAGLTIYFLLAVYQTTEKRKQIILSLFAGASFALGFYTYIAYRILVPIIGIIILLPLLGKIKEQKFWTTISSFKASVLAFVLAFIVFFSPLFYYFYTHPGSFVGRSGQVSVFNPELNQGNLPGAVYTVFISSLKAYFTDGDLNWRHNISNWPFLSPLISPFFGVGLILVTLMAAVYFFQPVKRASWWKYFLLAVWFWGMLIPVVTTAEGIPHGLRSIGTIPVVFIISAWALSRACELVKKFHERIWHRCEDCHDQHFETVGFVLKRKIAGFALKLVVVCFLLALTAQTYFGYFVYAYNSPENFYAFRSDLTVVSEYLKQRCDRPHTYLVLDKFSVQTTDYLTSDPHGNFAEECNVPYRQVDPENAWELRGLLYGDQIVFTQSSIYDIKKFKQHNSNARLKVEHRNKFGQAVMAVYAIE